MIDSMPDESAEILRVIRAIGDLEKQEENYQSKIAEKIPNRSQKAAEVWLNDSFSERNSGIIRFETKDKGSHSWYYLTDEGKKIYNAITPLFAKLKDIQEVIDDYRSLRRRDPTKEEIENNIGRKLKEAEVSYIRKEKNWEEPSEELIEDKKEELIEMLAWYVAQSEDDLEEDSIIQVLNRKERKDFVSGKKDSEFQKVTKPIDFDEYVKKNKSDLEEMKYQKDEYGFWEVRPPEKLASPVGGRFWIAP